MSRRADGRLEPPDLHLALALDRHQPERDTLGAAGDAAPRSRAQMDAGLGAKTGEAGRNVDRVAPEIVAKLLPAEHASDDRADVDADPHLPARGQRAGRGRYCRRAAQARYHRVL